MKFEGKIPNDSKVIAFTVSDHTGNDISRQQNLKKYAPPVRGGGRHNTWQIKKDEYYGQEQKITEDRHETKVYECFNCPGRQNLM